MRKTFLIGLVFFSLIRINAQVGINTVTPDHSSILDVVSTDKGVLLPRIALTSTLDTSSIFNPATSLLIYNTSTVNDVVPGYYYWDGAKWVGLSGGDSSEKWDIHGNNFNAGTGSEFLGTTTYHPLTIKVNNTSIGRLHPNGSIYFGLGANANGNNSIALGYNALANLQNSVAIGYNSQTQQNDAIALGYGANASGYQSAAIGYNSKTNANSTTAIGFATMADGYQATAVGCNSKASATSTTALGFAAVASGYQSTAIGYGATAPQDNSIILGSSTNYANKIGIGTNTPDERLHVVGKLKLVDGTQSAGNVLISDANGVASWADPDLNKAFGEITKAINSTLIAGTIDFSGASINTNVIVNANSIQVLKTGTYRITYSVTITKTGTIVTTPYFYLSIWGTEVPNTRTYCTIAKDETRVVTLTKFVNLNSYDDIRIDSGISDATVQVLANATILNLELMK